MKLVCKYGRQPQNEDETIAVEASSVKQVERYVYDFIFEPFPVSNDYCMEENRSDIRCSVVEFDCKNEEHTKVLKEQDGIFWEV